VTLHANSIAEALYGNKFKTPTRTGTVSVNCTEKSSDLGEISAVTVRLGVR